MQSDTDLTPERKKMKTTGRPLQAVVYTLLFLLSGIFMALLGMSASAYYYSAACLILQALLIWTGSGYKPFKRILELNQLSGMLLILTLCFGDALHLPKLDIAGVMLLTNVFTGGPLMSILATPVLASLLLKNQLPLWFGACKNKMPSKVNNLSHGE